MSRKCKFTLYVVLSVLLTGFLVLFMKNHVIAVLDPQGIIALKQKDLLVITTLIMLIVVLPALFLTFAFAWKYREGNKNAKYDPTWDSHVGVEVVWWSLPTLIILVLSVITWKTCHELDPFQPIDSKVAPMKIQVVALQWKWLFLYPEQKIASLNEVRFPEKTPIHFEITAEAPMNSFWIPQLGGQIYAMEGMSSALHLMADKQGSFRGSSANLSGDGFSAMHFMAKACSEQDFNAWVSSAQQSTKALNLSSYKELVLPSQDNPVSTYVLETEDLYDRIIKKYMVGE